MQKNLFKRGVIVILAIVILVVLLLLIFKNTNNLAGKAVSSEDAICTDSDGTDAWTTQGTVTVRESDGTTAVYTDSCEGTVTADYVCEGNRAVKHSFSGRECVCQNGACIPVQCSGNECNPSDTKQICSQGKWIVCEGESVCYAGACVKPSKANAKIIAGGGGADSGGGGGSSTGTTTTQSQTSPETTRTIGTISGTVTEDISANEKIFFVVENTEHSLKVSELLTTTMNAVLDGSSFTLSVGEEKRSDFDGDGADDLSIILKSISLTTKKARVLINVH